MQAKAASVALGKEGCGAGELLLASYKLLHEVLGNIEDFWPSFKPSRCHLPAFPFPTPLLGASSASASLVAPSDRSDPDATALLRLFFLSFFWLKPPPKKMICWRLDPGNASKAETREAALPRAG